MNYWKFWRQFHTKLTAVEVISTVLSYHQLQSLTTQITVTDIIISNLKPTAKIFKKKQTCRVLRYELVNCRQYCSGAMLGSGKNDIVFGCKRRLEYKASRLEGQATEICTR